MEGYSKRYVDVVALMRADGMPLPLRVEWEDGVSFPVDRVEEIRRAYAPHVGGCGLRYKCVIARRERYLYLEEVQGYKWFVEQRVG